MDANIQQTADTGRSKLSTLLRSGAVGVVATLVDLALLVLFVDVAGWSKAAANIPALTVGLAIQFVGNKYYAFDSRNGGGELVRQGVLFAVIEVGAFVLNAAAFHVLAVWGGAHHLLGRVIGSAAVYFGFSYPLWHLVFRPKAAKTGANHLGGSA